jgi:hypothetical protein
MNTKHIFKNWRCFNEAIRAITKSKYNATASQLFKDKNILKLSDIYNKQISIFMYDLYTINKIYLPTSLSYIFTSNIIQLHPTRHHNDIHIDPSFGDSIKKFHLPMSTYLAKTNGYIMI